MGTAAEVKEKRSNGCTVRFGESLFLVHFLVAHILIYGGTVPTQFLVEVRRLWPILACGRGSLLFSRILLTVILTKSISISLKIAEIMGAKL